MNRLGFPLVALALVASASADPRAARVALQQAYWEVHQQIEPVAFQARIAEELRVRASRVDHEITLDLIRPDLGPEKHERRRRPRRRGRGRGLGAEPSPQGGPQ